MNYIDVCSGISAPTMAWKPLGWQALCFAEIEAAPRAILSHHYPDVPLHGDFTKIKGDEHGPVDLLVGGTPCQSFSVAGLRGGMADERGNLALEYLRLADRARPRWLVWENVPGVLSSGGGRDFGSFLGGLAQLGYGFAYRVLDAQFFGVPQRRRRVFVVGHLGDWRRAAAVLFERHSLSGHPAPRREKGQNAPTIPSRSTAGGGLGTDFDCDGGLIHAPEISPALKARDFKGPSSDGDGDGAPLIAHSLRGEGFDASEDGTGRGTPLVPVAFNLRGREDGAQPEIDPNNLAAMRAASGGSSRSYIAFDARQSNACVYGDLTGPMDTKQPGPAVAFAQNTRDELREMNVVGALAANPGMKQTGYIRQTSAVRRLTPMECERLQGFPDGFTLVPYRKGVMADGPRYKALGNSMAVPVLEWIGERIALVDTL